MEVHAEIQSKNTGTGKPRIYFLLRFRWPVRGICQSGIRTAVRTYCFSHTSTQRFDFCVEPWTFYMEFLPSPSATSHAVSPLLLFKFP